MYRLKEDKQQGSSEFKQSWNDSLQTLWCCKSYAEERKLSTYDRLTAQSQLLAFIFSVISQQVIFQNLDFYALLMPACLVSALSNYLYGAKIKN